MIIFDVILKKKKPQERKMSLNLLSDDIQGGPKKMVHAINIRGDHVVQKSSGGTMMFLSVKVILSSVHKLNQSFFNKKIFMFLRTKYR